ncbi:MAG: 30S ribosomal protein S17 [Gammaproteobacteria bacterium]|nr:30S ribosomal protein S17 [Gammaproteobacteria bacterium]
MAEAEKLARALVGVVVSNKMTKTIVVKVERKIKHPVYGKYIKKSKNYHVHDEENRCSIGDTVQIIECRPMSKTKSWMLEKVIEQVAQI